MGVSFLLNSQFRSYNMVISVNSPLSVLAALVNLNINPTTSSIFSRMDRKMRSIVAEILPLHSSS